MVFCFTCLLWGKSIRSFITYSKFITRFWEFYIWKPVPSNYSFNLVVVSVFAGRRRKGYNSLLMYPLLLGGTFIPLAFGALALLAGKALIVSKLALALAAIVGLKKLVGGGGGESYQVGGPWSLFFFYCVKNYHIA